MTDQEKVLNDWEYMYQADTKGMFQSLATLAGQGHNGVRHSVMHLSMQSLF